MKKKFDFKLNTDAPGQHMAILVIAFVFIWLSAIEAIKAPSESDAERGIKRPYAESGLTLYSNPQMTWYERMFCRGYQRTTACSFRLLHPFKEVFDDYGIVVKEEPPKKNVIDYRGPLPTNRALSSRILLKSTD